MISDTMGSNWLHKLFNDTNDLVTICS